VDREPFRPWTPPPFWEEAQGLDWEVVTVPALVPILTRVLERLCTRLSTAQLAIDALELRLALATGGHHARTVALAAPLAEPAPIVALLALEIETHPPPAAVTGVAVSARALPRRAAPGRLWHPLAPAPRDLAAVLARLSLLVGAANVGNPAVVDSHRPDDHIMTPFDVAKVVADVREEDAGSTIETDTEVTGALGLRRLRPPRRVDVDTREGRPAHVRAAGLDAAVVTCAGPWRMSGHWWGPAAWAHDEWDVQLTDGALWRLTHDRTTDTWSLTALYD
jgi:protein ImuB